MTKRELFNLEQDNPGNVYLFPEGMFYKAYERSAYLLCKYVQAFKVSSRIIKDIPEALVSVGFPMASLEKFSQGVQIIENQSIAHRGGGKILLDAAPAGPLLLTNALYFNAGWGITFDEELLTAPFYGKSGAKDAQYFTRTGSFAYYRADGAQLVSIPYGKGLYDFVVVLPDEGKTPSDALSRLSPASLYISDIVQKAFVAVNEKGTEAAAVTVVELIEKAGPGSGTAIPQFIANRPFLFLIRETGSNTILFIGVKCQA